MQCVEKVADKCAQYGIRKAEIYDQAKQLADLVGKDNRTYCESFKSLCGVIVFRKKGVQVEF